MTATQSRACAHVLGVVFLLGFIPPASAQDGARFFNWLKGDISSVAKGPSTQTLTFAAIEVASLGVLSMMDHGVNHEVQEGYSGTFADYVNVVNRLGNPEINLVAAGLFGTSLMTRNTRFQDAAFTSLESFVLAGLLTESLKFIIGRSRPEENLDEYTFRPFNSNKSFPSGHSTKAFALLTPWAIYYPGVHTYALLVVGAGGTALARIAKDKHWMTDVIAGTSIGFFTARSLSRSHKGESSKFDQAEFHLGPTGIRATITF